MFVSAYDATRVILVGIHVGDALSSAELDDVVASVRRQAADAAARGVAAASLIFIETDQLPTAVQRKRLSAASEEIKWGYQAFVTTSPLARAVLTVFRWLRPSSDRFQQSEHATYELARNWLALRTGYPSQAFDELHAEARARVQRMTQAMS
jgi:hypothetical protein